MEFQQVKNFCKYAGPGVLCPDNYNHCNANNCPLAIQSIIDEQECDRYCPIVDKYRKDVSHAQYERDECIYNYKCMLGQFEQIETELKTTIDASFGVLNGILYDLKDKLKTTIKRLEP